MMHSLAALAAVLLSATGSAVGAPAPTPYQFHRPAAHRVPAALAASACPASAPTTAAGYTAMFGRLTPTAWGAGDTALTVPMGARSVWLYSDTAYAKPGAVYDVLSGWARMTHSSAIVQTGGCLHISNHGGQVLPNDPTGLYYWIDSATRLNSAQLRVVGFEMRPGDWTTGSTGRFRAALVNLSTAGDLTFSRWLGYVPAPHPYLTKDGGWLGNTVSITATGRVVIPEVLPLGSVQYSYSPQAHRELRLASGKTLVSLAIGWPGTTPHTWGQWRPIYREVTLP